MDVLVTDGEGKGDTSNVVYVDFNVRKEDALIPGEALLALAAGKDKIFFYTDRDSGFNLTASQAVQVARQLLLAAALAITPKDDE